MDQKLYSKIRSKWPKGRRYQGAGGKKQKYTMSQVEKFQGRTVVDIGCNAGINTYDILEHADKVIGVERDDFFYKQALITKEFAKKPFDVEFSTMESFLKNYQGFYDAAFASCVLYHLSTEEIDLIRDVMIPKCEIVIFVSRQEKKEKTENPYRLHKWVNIQKFLREAGMTTEVFNEKANWVSVVGRKHV